MSDGEWLGECEALGIMSGGDVTQNMAQSVLVDLIGLVLHSWGDDGVLDEQLAMRGIVVCTAPHERHAAERSLSIPVSVAETLRQPAMF